MHGATISFIKKMNKNYKITTPSIGYDTSKRTGECGMFQI